MSANVSIVSPNYFTFGTPDYAVFVLMLALSTAIGIYFGFFGKGADTTEEYLLGGKRMKTLPIAISLVASQLSGIAIMSLPAEIYSFGITHSFTLLSMFVCIPILCYVIIPVFYNNGILNCYEYLELRFDKRIRQLVTAIFVVTVYMMLPVFIFVPALAFSQVTGANIHLTNGVVCFICVFYTMLGGIKAVVWTDVAQGGIMLGSVIIVGVMGTYQVGGLGKVWDLASEGGRLDPNWEFDLTTRVTVWNTFFGGIFMWTGYVGLNQSCVQRIVALPSLGHARRALVLFGIGFLAIIGLNCFTGIILFARYYDCDPVKAGAVERPDKIMPFFVQDIVGHLKGMPGIFISAVFSAALSTMSANLNSLSGIFYFDYVKPFINHTEHKANLIMRAFVFVTAFYCLAGGLAVGKFKSIIQMIITISGLTHGAILGIFTLGMFVPKAHAKAGLYGIIFSIAALLWIICGAQIKFSSGELKYDPLPTSTDGCDAFNIKIPSSPLQNTSEPAIISTQDKSGGFSLYDISFHWYKVIGAACVWILAVPLSYLLPAENEKLDPKLLTPIVRKYFDVKYSEVPLKEKSIANKDSMDAPSC